MGLFLACELAMAECSVLVLEKGENLASPLKRLPFSIPNFEFEDGTFEFGDKMTAGELMRDDRGLLLCFDGTLR